MIPKLATRQSASAAMALAHHRPIIPPRSTYQDDHELSLRQRTSNILLRSLFYVKRTKIAAPRTWYNVVPADGFILDLEDAVPYDKKLETRAQVSNVLEQLPEHELPHILVRVNCLHDDHPDADWRQDIENTVHRRLLAYIVPKTRHPDEIREVSEYLRKCERDFGLPVGHHKVSLFTLLHENSPKL